MVKEYSFNGLAGCVRQRRSIKCGVQVSVYHAEQAGLCASGGPWVTVCEDHGAVCNHASVTMAVSHATDPAGWCETCKEAQRRKLESG